MGLSNEEKLFSHSKSKKLIEISVMFNLFINGQSMEKTECTFCKLADVTKLRGEADSSAGQTWAVWRVGGEEFNEVQTGKCKVLH